MGHRTAATPAQAILRREQAMTIAAGSPEVVFTTILGIAIVVWAVTAFIGGTALARRPLAGAIRRTPSAIAAVFRLVRRVALGVLAASGVVIRTMRRAASVAGETWRGKRPVEESGASVRDTAALSEVAGPRAAPPPAIPGSRYPKQALEELGVTLENSRRLLSMTELIVPVLGTLPRDRWLVERQVVMAGHRIPFLIIGETGVFTLWATDGRVRWDEVPWIGEAAEGIRHDLPDYSGTVQIGVCRPRAVGLTPSFWARPGAGFWQMGLDGIKPWLAHFGTEHGFGVEDVKRLRQMAELILPAEPAGDPATRIDTYVPDINLGDITGSTEGARKPRQRRKGPQS